MYERHALAVEEYVRAFTWREGQAGVAFAIGGQLLGLDLLDQPATMRRIFPKLLRSYALDALDAPNDKTDPVRERQLAEFLAQVVVAPSFAQPAVGIGKDVRFTGSLVSGAALWAEERYIHVCAFAMKGLGGHGGLKTQMNRPSRRGM
jgi:hypothetical protein